MGESRTTLVAAALLLAAQPLPAEGLRLGFATRVITPPLDGREVYLAGFGHGRLATGVHDDLHARCVAVGDGRERVVLAALDLIGFFLDDTERTRALLAARAPGATLLVASTHNHEGPDTLGLWGPNPITSGTDPAYMETLRQQVADCAAGALSRLAPARVVLAKARTPGLIEDGRLPRVIDDELVALQALGGDGRTMGTLVSWSSHPEALGGKNTLVSADYPGYLVRRMESGLGGTAVFVTGSIGGLLTPLGVKLEDADGKDVPPESFAHAQAIGERAAERALEALRAGRPSSSKTLVVRRARLAVPLENGHFRLALGLRIFDRRLFTKGAPDARTGTFAFEGQPLALPLGEDLETEITYLRIGDLEALGVPGEIYPELVIGGIQDPQDAGADFPGAAREAPLRGRLTSDHRMVIGLCNDEIGYVIPRSQWDERPPYAYGRPQPQYGEINSVGPGVAPALAEAFARLLSLPLDRLRASRAGSVFYPEALR